MSREPNLPQLPRGPGMGASGMAARMAGAARARNTGAAFSRLARSLGTESRSILVAIVMTAASVAASSLGPWQLGRATDLVVNDLAAHRALDFPALERQLAVVAALFVSAALLNWRQAWLVNDLIQRFSLQLRNATESKLSRLPLAWFDAQPHGEVLSRITNDIDNITQSLQQLLSQLLMSLLSLIAVISVMMLLSPLLALIALLMLAFTVILTRSVSRRSSPHFKAQWQLTGALNGEIEESFTGHVLVKVYSHRARAIARFDEVNAALAQQSFLAQMMGGLIQPLAMAAGNLGLIAVVVGGALRILAGALTLGELQAFIQYVRQINHPMQQVASMAAIVQSGLASAERVFEMLDLPEMPSDPVESALLGAVKGHVVFDRVSFAYRPDRPLFRDVCLTALPGQTVAIVGPTGAGKTTLVNLLMRFYEIDSGRIFLDGTDTRQMRREDLRRQIGMVLQDTWIFSGSLRHNLTYGRPEATEAEILEAASTCLLDPVVRTLPQGYDTMLDSDSGLLSMGQRQLLTIARAFLMRPSVLILDEATSSVDTRTEILVQQALARLRQGRTSFVIAHRLSTIRSADLIVYMENGAVQEQGTHDSLMAARGRYWALHQSQFVEGGTADDGAGVS